LWKLGERETYLSLQSIDDIERCDSLPLGVFSVCDGITDDALKEGLEDWSSLLIDHGWDTLDTTTAGKTADGRLGDTLDVVSQNLSVTLEVTLVDSDIIVASMSSP
jgi:hypothetical protein